ncbi:PREDICTED: cytoplasmic tRNA 2-thiolation protein 2 [Dufourea novaeangliae]|uniref:cytoplasmic tRNA 2-thiolation protein 2 n=1 Tax=Dufourea novaeangliae TaxID=178035 RepID=UPI000766F7C9|nr:PREDICTED: cytoplasmic tRNA 2-thiolation protein 2 [Dufourea novaeangliae]
MCTLNDFECDTFETDQTALNTDTACTIVSTCPTNINSFCKKCKTQKTEVSLRGKYGYCKTCFLSVSMHKFKATLGKSKLLRPSDSVLIAHSGKANSTVLLHLIKDNMNESASKRLQFKCKILYIDDGMVKGISLEERKHIQDALVKEAEYLEVTMYVTSLTTCTTDILCEKIQSVLPLQSSTTDNDGFMKEMFESMENDTVRDELLRQLKRKLLISAARKLNCNKIFVADTSVDLAIKVLGDVSTGRGSQLSVNVAFYDTRCADVALLRPLRDFTQEDIQGYLQCHKLNPILAPPKYIQPYPASIRNIARNFIHNLDFEFHGTVSTIYRTSEKLATKIKGVHNVYTNRDIEPINDMNNTCALCELPLISDNLHKEQLSVVQAKMYSQVVSTNMDFYSSMTSSSQNLDDLLKDKQTGRINDCEKKHCECNNTECSSFCGQSLQPSMVEADLCYGCKIIALNSNRKINLLSSFIYDKIQENIQMTRLRNEITEFLL